MPVYDRLLGLAQTKQQIESGEMLNQLRGVEIAQTIRNMQVEDQTARIVQQEAMVRMARRDKLQQTEGAEDAVGKQPPALQESYKAMKESQQEFEYWNNLATSVQAQGGAANAKAASQFQVRAEKAQSQNLQAQIRNRVAEQDLNKEIASEAGAYNPDTADYTISKLNRLKPGWDRQFTKAERDENGNMIAGPNTQKAMQTLARAGETANQQNQRDLEALRVTVQQLNEKLNARRVTLAEDNAVAQQRRAREKVEDAKDKEIAKTEAAKLKLAGAVKEPPESQLMATSASLARRNDLNPDDARAAGRYQLMREQELRNSGMDTDQAERQARADLAKRIVPNADSKAKNKNTYDPEGNTNANPLQKSIAAVNDSKNTKAEIGKDGRIKLRGSPTVLMSQAQQALDMAKTDKEKQDILDEYNKRNK